MAFETLTDLDCDKTISLGGIDKKTGKSNPTRMEGYYLGIRKVPSTMTESGLCNLHIFQTKTGNVGVWGKTNLDMKLMTVTPGTMTRITFTGMKKTKKRDMYAFKVEVDKENTIEVAVAPGTSQDDEETSTVDGGYDGSGDETTFQETYDDGETETELDQDEVQPDDLTTSRATPPPANKRANGAAAVGERAARAKELLAKANAKRTNNNAA